MIESEHAVANIGVYVIIDLTSVHGNVHPKILPSYFYHLYHVEIWLLGIKL